MLQQQKSGSTALLADDVLHLSVYGPLDGPALERAIVAASQLHHPREYGAVLFDLTGAMTDDIVPAELALHWHAHMPRRPSALLHRGDSAEFCTSLMLRLASRPAFPSPLEGFRTVNKSQAIAWCRDRAATFRDLG